MISGPGTSGRQRSLAAAGQRLEQGETGWRLELDGRTLDVLSPVGVVLRDGGMPVSDFARQLAGERWHEIAAELLLTAEPPADAG